MDALDGAYEYMYAAVRSVFKACLTQGPRAHRDWKRSLFEALARCPSSLHRIRKPLVILSRSSNDLSLHSNFQVRTKMEMNEGGYLLWLLDAECSVEHGRLLLCLRFYPVSSRNKKKKYGRVGGQAGNRKSVGETAVCRRP